MDMNEMLQQMLASNPQFAGQVMQLMQQHGMAQNNRGNQSQQMNWNMPTNPMASMFLNYMNAMNNQNNQQPAQNQQTNQNQQQQTITPTQKSDGGVTFVRVVKSPDEIRPDEVPMSDTIRLFLQEDLSTIYGKRWTNNGTVDNMRFVLQRDDQKEMEQSNDLSKILANPDVFFGKISEIVSEIIDEKLSRLNLTDKSQQTKSGNNKKGVEENGN